MKIDLITGWELRSEGLDMSAGDWPLVDRKADGWLLCALPCDVRMPLIQKGIIAEPLEGLNCFDSEWVEDRSWWFRRRFVLDAVPADAAECRLRFEMLDVHADVFLNGSLIGHHASAFYPFEADVKSLLVEGENVLGVRLTTGLERVRDEDFAGYSRCIATEALAGRGTRGDKRRAHLRKPQYVFGWDWGPRVATCAIVGDASLTFVGAVRAASVRAVTRAISAGAATLAVTVEAENTHPWSTREARVSVRLFDGKRVAAEEEARVLLRSGINHVEFELTVPGAKLWWPNGCGEQPLYGLEAMVDAAEAPDDARGRRAGSAEGGADTVRTRIGIRTIELDQTPEHGGRRFALVVNGVPIHCKGSNWIPADSLYARVTDEKYRSLVREAAAANFTMLRIWGGGRYESDTFYDACDEAGILIWHDFMFACAIYPDNRAWFREEVRREADYQTRRLRNHPSMALWCGSNEDNWGFVDWWNGGANPKAPFWGGAQAYNYILPETVRANSPEIPYWNGSPYGGAHPNSCDAGDCHFWLEGTMSREMAKRIAPEVYDTVEARFVTEYGCIGPCVKSSIVRYHGGKAVDLAGPIHQHHNNTFEKETVPAGIRRHYRDPEGMSLDQYLLYASLVQGLLYGYSLESLRANPRNNGSLFWMYADCWGEVGWTIIDYYLQRKPSWYHVRRAFAPHKLVMRERGGAVEVTGMNDTASDFPFRAEYGWIGFDGTGASVKETRIVLPARSRSVVLRLEKGKGDPHRGISFIRPLETGEVLLPATHRQLDFRDLALVDPGLAVSDQIPAKDGTEFTVRARAFAHAVHFGLGDDARPSDEYFDLLPNESRRIRVRSSSPITAPIRVVSVR